MNKFVGLIGVNTNEIEPDRLSPLKPKIYILQPTPFLQKIYILVSKYFKLNKTKQFVICSIIGTFVFSPLFQMKYLFQPVVNIDM